jgi:hypothetical protein
MDGRHASLRHEVGAVSPLSCKEKRTLKRSAPSVFRFRFHILAVLGVAALGSAASAAEVSRFKQKDRVLVADFASHSDDGCVSTLTSFRFNETISKLDGSTPTDQPTTLIDVEYADACTGEFLSLSGGTTTQTVAFTGDVAGATYSAVVPVTDGVNSADVTLDLTWTGNGDLQTSKQHFKTTDGNTTTMDKSSVTARNADASGSITVTLPLAAGPTTIQLAQFPLDGLIAKDAVGERTVTKKN